MMPFHLQLYCPRPPCIFFIFLSFSSWTKKTPHRKKKQNNCPRKFESDYFDRHTCVSLFARYHPIYVHHWIQDRLPCGQSLEEARHSHDFDHLHGIDDFERRSRLDGANKRVIISTCRNSGIHMACMRRTDTHLDAIRHRQEQSP